MIIRGLIRVVVFLLVLVGVAIGGYTLWNYLESYESTDDAEIDGDIYAVTSRIAGTVKAVYVEDNQEVKAGQLLIELDPRDYEVSLEQTKAALNESRTLVAVASCRRRANHLGIHANDSHDLGDGHCRVAGGGCRSAEGLRMRRGRYPQGRSG